MNILVYEAVGGKSILLIIFAVTPGGFLRFRDLALGDLLLTLCPL